MTANTDFQVRDEGSIVLLIPTSPEARAWVEEHIGEDNGYQPAWPTVVIEHRYASDILRGALGDGLTVEGFCLDEEEGGLRRCGPLCPMHGDPRDTGLGLVTEQLYGKQDVEGFFGKAARSLGLVTEEELMQAAFDAEEEGTL